MLTESPNQLVGQSCYCITHDMNYNFKFNNQNFRDENLTKIILMMPMVPKRRLDQVQFSGDLEKPRQSETNEHDAT